MRADAPDAIVVGSGPNGLAAAITLPVPADRSSCYEAPTRSAAGCAAAELTLPGFVHDVCSADPRDSAVASPFFRALRPAAHGVELDPPAGAARPPAR